MSEERVREIAWTAWKGAANAFRLYPDNKHTFTEYWNAAKNQFTEYIEKYQATGRQLSESEKQLLQEATQIIKDKDDQIQKLYGKLEYAMKGFPENEKQLMNAQIELQILQLKQKDEEIIEYSRNLKNSIEVSTEHIHILLEESEKFREQLRDKETEIEYWKAKHDLTANSLIKELEQYRNQNPGIN